MRMISCRLTSVIRSYSFVVTAGERIKYGRDVHVAVHTAAETNRRDRRSLSVRITYISRVSTTVLLYLARSVRKS